MGEGDKSSFYRKRIIGDYKNHFDESNINTFKMTAKDELQLLQYEIDDCWS